MIFYNSLYQIIIYFSISYIFILFIYITQGNYYLLMIFYIIIVSYIL